MAQQNPNKINMSDPEKRKKMTECFKALYIAIFASDELVDYNISQLEDTIVTCLGKLDVGVAYTIKFNALNPIKMKLGPTGNEVVETATQIPIKWVSTATLKLGLAEKSIFIAFFKEIYKCFTETIPFTRRNLEVMLSMYIVRSARRQDILYNKKPSIKWGQRAGSQNISYRAEFTPLFKNQQTYARFKSLISNHVGIGALIELIAACTDDDFRKPLITKLVKRMSHPIQQAAAKNIYNMNGLRLDIVEKLLESCFVSRPREGNAFINLPILFSTNANETYDMFKDAYNSSSIHTVIFGQFPWVLIEILTAFGIVYDDLGICEHMFGISGRREEFQPEAKVVISTYTFTGGTYLAPLKGSASGSKNMSIQRNTQVAVHGKRKLEDDDVSWISTTTPVYTSVDPVRELRKFVEDGISNPGRILSVCDNDVDLNITRLGFWNNSS